MRSLPFGTFWLCYFTIFLHFQHITSLLEPGMAEVLEELHSKSLRKVAAQTDKGTDSIDDTVLI